METRHSNNPTTMRSRCRCRGSCFTSCNSIIHQLWVLLLLLLILLPLVVEIAEVAATKSTPARHNHHHHDNDVLGVGRNGATTSIHDGRRKMCRVNDNSSSGNALLLVPPRGGSVAVRIPKIQEHHANKFANFQQRLLPAVLLLAGLYLIVHTYQAPGVTVLLLLLTPGLYHEAVSVVLPSASSSRDKVRFSWAAAFQWWWFLTASLATTIPQACAMMSSRGPPHPHTSSIITTATTEKLQLASYGMLVTGFVAWIYRLNRGSDPTTTTVERLQSAWNELAVHTMAVIFTVLPVALWMAVLRLDPQHGLTWALYTAFLVIVNDSMAYLFGFTLGKHALLPNISPKKTWEGWGGALVATVALSRPLWNVLFAAVQTDPNAILLPYNQHALIVALFCSLVAPLGGFLASSLKRAGGKKDFGNLIAGHGGLVDRLDCQLLAAPFLFLYLRTVLTTATTVVAP